MISRLQRAKHDIAKRDLAAIGVAAIFRHHQRVLDALNFTDIAHGKGGWLRTRHRLREPAHRQRCDCCGKAKREGFGSLVVEHRPSLFGRGVGESGGIKVCCLNNTLGPRTVRPAHKSEGPMRLCRQRFARGSKRSSAACKAPTSVRHPARKPRSPQAGC